VLPPALFSSVAVKSVSVRRNSPLPATGSVFDRLIIVVSGCEDACPTGSRLVPAAEELAAIQRDYLAGWDDYIDELQPKDDFKRERRQGHRRHLRRLRAYLRQAASVLTRHFDWRPWCTGCGTADVGRRKRPTCAREFAPGASPAKDGVHAAADTALLPLMIGQTPCLQPTWVPPARVGNEAG